MNMVFFILNKNRIIRGDFLKVEILNVIQCHKVAGKGVTNPCYVTLDNGTNVYIKYPNNPEGDLVLLNEWISASIGKLVNINIPNFGLCYLNKGVISKIDFLKESNTGLCFYSEEVRDVFPLTTPGIFRKFITCGSEFIKLLLFDHIIYNKDRNRGNLLLTGYRNNKRIFVIDQSHVFKNETIWDRYTFLQGTESCDFLDKEILESNQGTYQFYSESVTINRVDLLEEVNLFKSALTKEAIRDIFKSIPEEFKLASANLPELENYLNYRIEHINQIQGIIYDYFRGCK